jgi:hypothetical protein
VTKMISDKDDMTTTLTPTESEDQFLHSNTHKDYVFIGFCLMTEEDFDMQEDIRNFSPAINIL